MGELGERIEAMTPINCTCFCLFSQAPPPFVHSHGAGSSEVGDAPYQALSKTIQSAYVV